MNIRTISLVTVIDWREVLSQIFFFFYIVAFCGAMLAIFWSVSFSEQFRGFDNPSQVRERYRLQISRNDLALRNANALRNQATFPGNKYPDYIVNSPEVQKAFNAYRSEQEMTDSLTRTKLAMIQARQRNQLLAAQERANLDAARRRAEAEAEEARGKKEAADNAWKQWIPKGFIRIN